MQNPGWIPEWLAFIQVTDDVHVALIFQLLILEFAIDGLRLAAVNTPSMLTTPLSVIAGIVLGEYSVKSGWFNSETMLYMAFVTIANYSQTSFELGCLKVHEGDAPFADRFLQSLGLYRRNRYRCPVPHIQQDDCRKSYIYPLVPFSFSELKKSGLCATGFPMRKKENHDSTLFATTKNLPSFWVYSQVVSVISRSGQTASAPVS